MSFSDLSVIKKLSLGILFVTGFITFVMGVIVFVPIFYDEPDLASAAIPAVRMPASIRAERFEVSEVLPGPPRVETLDLKCIDRQKGLEVSSLSKFTRLVGRLCDHDLDVDKFVLVNRSNGFEVTLFSLESGRFSTDYIQLVAGRNHITFDSAHPDGGISGELWIDFSEPVQR